MSIQLNYGIEEAITPLDGRNKNKLSLLTPYFSDLALDKYRILAELQYLKKLSEYKVVRKLTSEENILLEQIVTKFNKKDYYEIRKLESTTNHEMKAVEEYLKKILTRTSLKDIIGMIHFGLTSEDINNIAYALMIKNSLQKIIFPEIVAILEELSKRAVSYKSIPMLGRTHGQPAVPTTIGKEFLVYYRRLREEIQLFQSIKIKAKLTGNVGNLNAHKFVFPEVNWLKFSREFVGSFGLEPDLVTTQVEPYDSYIHIFSGLLRINHLFLGLCRDLWLYIMLGYFKQKVLTKEVGSTALPHKVNPIYFEGSEGGFEIANSLLALYCRKLSQTRLQRDLSDSTVRRSVGIAFGYSLLSYQSLREALKRIEPDEKKIRADLDNHWEVLSEAIQNYLRTKNFADAYEKAKNFFRGKNRRQDEIKKFISTLHLAKEDRKKLADLAPEKYIGYAEELVDEFSNK